MHNPLMLCILPKHYSIRISMQELIAAILARPEAQHIVDEANTLLEEERRQRQLFYQTIDEDTKAEFVNGEVYY